MIRVARLGSARIRLSSARFDDFAARPNPPARESAHKPSLELHEIPVSRSDPDRHKLLCVVKCLQTHQLDEPISNQLTNRLIARYLPAELGLGSESYWFSSLGSSSHQGDSTRLTVRLKLASLATRASSLTSLPLPTPTTHVTTSPAHTPPRRDPPSPNVQCPQSPHRVGGRD